MAVKEMICVACPLGCGLRVELDDMNNILSITGNTCKRGEAYARTEITNPMRSFTSTVRVNGGNAPFVSVKSKTAMPKDLLFAAAEATRGVILQAPVAIGDCVIADVAGCGVDLVATNRVGSKN
ncbi:MAG: DUF1667 domain-containing protein [Oscillospiraceae bacterium]|jgi:CxxC motif-containing protein|nr:DUF1667 domain-containing protein [Oscillospiraceae bacterium]